MFPWTSPDDVPPPKSIHYQPKYKSQKSKVPKAGGGGGDSKPPKTPKSGGGLCIQVAPYAAWPALLALAGVIVKSLT